MDVEQRKVVREEDKLSVALMKHNSGFHFSTGFFLISFLFPVSAYGNLIKPVGALQNSKHGMGHKSLWFH